MLQLAGLSPFYANMGQGSALESHGYCLNKLEDTFSNERRAMLSSQPVGKCGIFCPACRLYVLEKCKGCIDLGRKKVRCSVLMCAEAKGLKSCGRCQEFPCLEHYGSDQVFAKKKLLSWKKQEISRKDRESA
jgi:hypothetical protein